MRLQLFANPAAPTPDPITPTPGGEKGDKHKVPIEGKPDPKPADPPAPAPITFPDQATLNARLDRAGKSALEKAAKDAGFENAEAMAAAAKAARAAEEAAKTEAQRQADALAAAQKTATDAQTKAIESQTKADQKVIKAEVRSLAREMGAVDVEDVEALIGKTGKEITIDDDGNVVGAKEALEALKGTKAYLFGTAKAPAPAVGGGMNPPKTPPANMMEASQEEFAATLAGLGLRPHSSTKVLNPRKG